ncbi:hypothetical protein M3Y99_01463700 [Aphelenchoides fujianensis]|nr:hypothetical protein M3Y99_01463700 [Aphelenchoides fujianensis]
MCRLMLVPVLLAAVAAAQLASGDSESPDVYRRSVGSGQPLEGSGEEAFRTLECACILAEEVEFFEEAADQQPEDAYRRRRSADPTGGSGSGISQEPLAFVHQPTARSDGPNAAAVVARRIVVCKCEDAGEGSGDDEAANPSAAPAPTADEEESEVYRRSAASGEEEDAAPVRRSALDTAEASGDEEPTAATARLPTISTASLPTLSTRARRSAEGSAEEATAEAAEASGEEEPEVTIAMASTAELPTISTVEISTPSTAELPTIQTTPLTTRSLPTLASISTASTRPLTTASLPTLAPITRAQRHAEGSGAAEEQL